MILAAGEGARMRPLTNATPKPLLSAKGKPLLEHHIVRLRDAGFTELVVNTAYLGEQVAAFCGDGSRWGVRIQISREPVRQETAGGIIKALPLLGKAPFAVVNGDIYTDFPFQTLRETAIQPGCGHLILVANPKQHPGGDFVLAEHCVRQPERIKGEREALETLTFSGIALYHPDFFAGLALGKRPLKPLLDRAILDDRLTGQYFSGLWNDVGTPERLAALDQ
jgi:MurNAc alpha-1-phosphate uridylyltransferase